MDPKILADDPLVRPIVRPTTVAIRCELATLAIEIPEVDGNGVVVGSMLLDADAADEMMPQELRDAIVGAVKSIAAFRGVI